MSFAPFIPEGCYPVIAVAPRVNGAITSDFISLKNVQMAWIHVVFANATASTDAITIQRATAVAPTGNVAIVNTVPIWAGIMTAANTLLIRDTDAIAYLGADVTGNRVVVFQIDPASLGAGYDCLGFTIADSGHATNYVSATFWLLPRYERAPASQSATEYVVD
jgi:hypothetical protein